MLDALSALVAPALMQRLTLALNHVLASEAVATDRLRPHAGRTLAVALDGWPRLLPPPPALAFAISPAGLLEWVGGDPAVRPDLQLRIAAANPAALLARAIAGERPPVAIDGDSRLATDVDWLMQNLRWDIAADLDGLFGPVAAAQLQRIGAALAGGLRAAIQALNGLKGRDPGWPQR